METLAAAIESDRAKGVSYKRTLKLAMRWGQNSKERSMSTKWSQVCSLGFALSCVAVLALAGCRGEPAAKPKDGPKPTEPSANKPLAPVDEPALPVAPPAPADEPKSPADVAQPPAPPSDEMPPPADTTAKPDETAAEPAPADLGDPLVDNIDKLARLDQRQPVWADWEGKHVVMVGQVVQTAVPLEMFACLKNTKEHESVVTVDVKAYAVHAALIAMGAKPGTPVQFDPEYKTATGPEIDVTVKWKDKDGKVQTARAQDWIRNQQTGKAMEHPWIFAGSNFFVDEDTQERVYMAEGGDFICVSNFPTALLDLPVASPQDTAELMFEAFEDRIPPRGTPVTIILSPKADKNAKPEANAPADAAPSPPADPAPVAPTEPASGDKSPAAPAEPAPADTK
jgi:drug/metabolite transporter superfamily protein YnfA